MRGAARVESSMTAARIWRRVRESDSPAPIRFRHQGRLPNWLRCIARKMPVRPRKAGATGTAEHFEHAPRHPQRSLGDRL